MEKKMETTGMYWSHIGMLENKMETTRMRFYRVWG